jgi:hypothetical protein
MVEDSDDTAARLSNVGTLAPELKDGVESSNLKSSSGSSEGGVGKDGPLYLSLEMD